MTPDLLFIGPYEAEQDTRTSPLLTELGRLNKIDPTGKLRDTRPRLKLGHLEAACVAAGVELGAFDRQVLTWLAGLEPETVQVVIGLITRATGGLEPGPAR